MAVVGQVVGRGKPARLVELFVVGQERFRHKSVYAAVLDDGGAVKQRMVPGNGNAYKRDDVEAAAELDEREQCLLRLFEQQLLLKEVLTRVGGDGQFRQTENFSPHTAGLRHDVFNLYGVAAAIGHADGRNGRCYFNKSVLHNSMFYCFCFYIDYSSKNVSNACMALWRSAVICMHSKGKPIVTTR